MISQDDAVAEACSQLGLGPLTPACAFRTRCQDYPGEAYYLVIFGEPQASVGVAAVDAKSGKVMNWAALPGAGPHLPINSEAAVRRTEFTAASTELVWKPCSASRSPLYPLWEVCSEDKTVYVDQQGVVWQSLESSGGG